MRLRPVQMADLPALAAIHAASFPDPWPAADLAALCASPGALALAAEDDAVRGFILHRVVAGEAEVLTLAVDPALRRRGIAQALLAAALGQARALGAEAMFLEVAQDNVAALALYGAAGFEPAGLRRGYYARPGAAPVDAAVLRCTLNRIGP